MKCVAWSLAHMCVSEGELLLLLLLASLPMPLGKAQSVFTCRLKQPFCIRISEGLVSFSSF